MPSLLLLFFFFKYKNKRHVDSQVWLKNCKWQVLIGRFGSAPLPSRILSSFFFLFFFLLSHTHTLVKFVADRFSPSPTMQLTSRKQHLLLQYVHTHVFLSNNIKEEQGKNDSHPEREKIKQVKKEKKYKYLCPAVTLHKWKKDWHWIQKYHNFYISNCLCWLLFRNMLISQESLSAETISIFNLLVFLFWLPLAVPIVQRTLHHCKYDLSWAVQRFLTNLLFFHITKLHFYSHIFKF